MSAQPVGVGEEYTRCSVWIGFISSTTTLTLRTASVFASSSPTPDDPIPDAEFQDTHALPIRTSGYEHNLLTPVKRFGRKEETCLISVEG